MARRESGFPLGWRSLQFVAGLHSSLQVSTIILPLAYYEFWIVSLG